MEKFGLYYNETHLGDITFNNGSYEFELDPAISLEDWNSEYGILPLDDKKGQRRLTNKTLFEQLNIRLPIQLRKEVDKNKLDFIKKQHLQVISDRYELRPK